MITAKIYSIFLTVATQATASQNKNPKVKMLVSLATIFYFTPISASFYNYDYRTGQKNKATCHQNCQNDIQKLVEACDPYANHPDLQNEFIPSAPPNCEQDLLDMEKQHRQVIWEMDESGHKNDFEIHKSYRDFNIHQSEHVKNVMFIGRLKARCESICEWELLSDCFEFCHDDGKNNNERASCSRECLKIGEKKEHAYLFL